MSYYSLVLRGVDVLPVDNVKGVSHALRQSIVPLVGDLPLKVDHLRQVGRVDVAPARVFIQR